MIRRGVILGFPGTGPFGYGYPFGALNGGGGQIVTLRRQP